MSTKRNRTQLLILTSMFTVLTAAGAFIKIPIGPVPISLQFLFVCLAGICLGPKFGAVSQLLYVGLGLAGLPIFAAGGGLGYVFNPSFGYLIGFIPAVIVIGQISDPSREQRFSRTLIACALGILVIYIIGVPYMYMIMRIVMGVEVAFTKAIFIGFLVFVPGDAVKCLCSAYLGKALVPVLRRQMGGAYQ